MNTEEILNQLRGLGEERAIVAWGRLGLDTAYYLGVNLTKLKAYAKDLGRSHETAVALWETGIHDAQLLATYIGEPNKLTPELAEQWVTEARFFDLSDRLCINLVTKTPFAAEKMRQWMDRDAEYVRRSGWILVRELGHAGSLDDDELAGLLPRIEAEIGNAPNWVREAMNYALMVIGSQNAELNRTTLATLDRIGTIVVDYGESSCKLPDAHAHLNSPRVTDRWKST